MEVLEIVMKETVYDVEQALYSYRERWEKYFILLEYSIVNILR